jgi:hypothetical protein
MQYLIIFVQHIYSENMVLLLLFILISGMNNNINKEIHLVKNQWTDLEDVHFLHATDGKVADYPTAVKIKADESYLHVSFTCSKDEYVDQNTYLIHNQPLFNQEVFEVFIASGKEDPDHYLELEINPNNAIWVGQIHNPSRGDKSDIKAEMVEPEASKIVHSATKTKKAWSGQLSIPWALIPGAKSLDYRVNFYRIVATKAPTKKDWTCSPDNCAFLCWNSTLSGKAPAFHRPRRFGKLSITD